MSSSGGETTTRSKDGVPQWDGNSATFQRYEEEALLWQEGIPYHKRYMSGPRLVAELQGAAKRMVTGKAPGWVSYHGGVEALMQHLRECLGRPQVAEMTDYLNQYFRNSRRRNGESINDYVTRKSEIYLRAQQALNRVRPHHDTASTAPTDPTYRGMRRSSWTSEATTTTMEGDDGPDGSVTETAATEADPFQRGRDNAQDHRNWWNPYYGGWSSYGGQGWWQGHGAQWSWNGPRGSGSTTAWQGGGVASKGVDLLPDWVQGWYLLQDANLTTSERNMIFTAIKGDFGVLKVSQELRNQWSEQDLKRRDQHYKASSFLGEATLDEEFADEAWAAQETHEGDEDLNDEGMALVAEAEDEAKQAWAAIQQAKRTLKEARSKQHQVRMSRKYYTSSSSTSSGRPRDDSKMVCLSCGKVGHRMANCPNPRQKANHAEAEAAPFVCYAEQALTGYESSAAANHGPTTAEAVQAGKGVIDGGATRTLGSVKAIEAIMKQNAAKTGVTGVKGVDLQNRPVFGFADSGEARCISTVDMDLQANGKSGMLKIHALNKGTGPVLISVSTLRALGAVIDFENDLLVLRRLDPKKIIQLQRSSTGHQLLDLTADLFEGAGVATTAVPDLSSYLHNQE